MDKISQLLSQTKLCLHPEKVAVVGLNEAERTTVAAFAPQDGCISLLFLPGEVTLICTESFWNSISVRFSAAKAETGFRLLTLDIILPWDVIGYLARVTAALAEAGVSMGVVSSHASDHLLVREKDLHTVCLALEQMGVMINNGENGK